MATVTLKVKINECTRDSSKHSRIISNYVGHAATPISDIIDAVVHYTAC